MYIFVVISIYTNDHGKKYRSNKYYAHLWIIYNYNKTIYLHTIQMVLYTFIVTF